MPAGKTKVLYLNSIDPVPTQLIQDMAAQAPGSAWYVLGEPNAHGKTVQDVLVSLHDTYAAIKQADPTALITSPSILNFGFSCINCQGYPTGGSWINQFRSEYFNTYGVDPPIDIWAIDVFPIVWPGNGVAVSEAFPTVNDTIVTQQVSDYRDWIDLFDASRGKPIWITEFGLHWGYPDWDDSVPGCNGKPTPVGAYQTEAVKQYLRNVYNWLETNSVAKNIQRWYTFSTYRDITVCQTDLGNGLTMFDSAGPTGNLTEIGQFFKDWVHGSR